MSNAREWYENGIPSEVLTQERFAAWLDTKPEGEILGRLGHMLQCPVATYLNEVVGDKDDEEEGVFYHILVGQGVLNVTKSHVEKNMYGDLGAHQSQNMPAWMLRTILGIDHGSFLFSPVTKERVVAAFEAAKGVAS